jgi:hypothetical protein
MGDICSCGDTLGDVDPRCPVHFPSRARKKEPTPARPCPGIKGFAFVQLAEVKHCEGCGCAPRIEREERDDG